MLKYFLVFLFITASNISMAQPGNEDPPVEVPIDGGILYLLGAALSYGIYHFGQFKSKLKSDK